MTRAKLRAEWIAALRSNNFAQTTGTLHRITPSNTKPAGYSCLGVACTILASRFNLQSGSINGVETFDDGTCKFDSTLPPVLVEALGLVDEEGSSYGVGPSLIALNDVRRNTFPKIADALESGRYWNPDYDPNWEVLP